MRTRVGEEGEVAEEKVGVSEGVARRGEGEVAYSLRSDEDTMM